MSDCASILSSATSPHHQDTRAKRRAARLRLPMTVRIPQFYHQVADEHEMSDDQYSSSDNEAFEEVILLPPVADEDIDVVHLPDLVPRNDDIFLQRELQAQFFRSLGRDLRDLSDQFVAMRLHQRALEKQNATSAARVDFKTVAMIVSGLAATAVVPYLVLIKGVQWVYS